VLLVSGNVFLGINCVHRALWNANRAVDALIGVYGQEIRTFAKAVYGADVDAVGVLAFDTSFGDGMGHVEMQRVSEKSLFY
jgi:hypothetical protein